jgi:CTP synthase (UTP-ammonia lyase)
MDQPLRIGIIGDFNAKRPSQMATNEALNHSAIDLSVALDIAWLPARQLETEFNEMELKRFDALWCGPGSYKSMKGALEAIRSNEPHHFTIYHRFV